MAGGKRGGPGRGSVTHPGPKDGEVSDADDDQERDAQFKLAFLESLDDPQIATKLGKIVTDANKHLVDLISTLREEVTSLRTALHDRDATIAQLRNEVQRLEDAHDALEQHGRRHCLRVSGISDAEDDTTAAVVSLANTVLKVQPPPASWGHKRQPSTPKAAECRGGWTITHHHSCCPAPWPGSSNQRKEKTKTIQWNTTHKDLHQWRPDHKKSKTICRCPIPPEKEAI